MYYHVKRDPLHDPNLIENQDVRLALIQLKSTADTRQCLMQRNQEQYDLIKQYILKLERENLGLRNKNENLNEKCDSQYRAMYTLDDVDLSKHPKWWDK